jgi:hypothetical protein
MPIFFRKSLKRLRKCVEHVDPNGRWKKIENDGVQYRCRNGAILTHFWRRGQTLHFHGNPRAAQRFKRKLIAFAQDKGLADARGINERWETVDFRSLVEIVQDLHHRVEELENRTGDQVEEE